MKEKLRAIFDSRMTWAGLGTMAGVVFGEQVAAAVNAFGMIIMGIL